MKRQPGKICTYCGKAATNQDHVIPKALSLKVLKERPIKVPSCDDCNHKSDEGLLKSFLSVFDDKLAAVRRAELTHPRGRGDLRKFLQCCTPDVKVAYATESITALFKKMFLGFRRHILNGHWTYLPASALHLCLIRKEGGEYTVRALPLHHGHKQGAFRLQAGLEKALDPDTFDYNYGGFKFTRLPCGTLLLRYERRNPVNELIISAIEVAAD